MPLTTLDSLREMLEKAHEAEDLPAEAEIRLPRQVVRALCREVLGRAIWQDAVATSAFEPEPWARIYTDWGCIYVRPLEAK